jgi:thiol-disulfide isomerase/thioredoxin
MKKFLLLACLLLTLQFVQAADEIRFEHDAWTEVLAKASSQNKLVFVDAYTTWCVPCKMMAKTAFVDPKVAEFFNSHFINAKIDMEHDEGPELAKKYAVNAYPTLLFIDGNGALVHAAVGARSAVDLLRLGNDVVNGNFTSLPKMTARFEAGERDRKFLKEYILTLADLAQDFAAPLAVYKEGMKGEALLDEDNWEVFDALFGRFDSEYAQYFLSHRSQFENKYGKKTVQGKATRFYENGVIQAAQSKDAAAFKDLRLEIAHSGIERMDSILPMLDFLWAEVSQDWKAMAKAAKKYIPLLQPDASMLNNVAWSFYEHVSSKSDLRRALVWIEQSITLEPEYANIDTKAMLLRKLGRMDEAIACAKKAIEVAKATGEDYAETEKDLEEMMKQ